MEYWSRETGAEALVYFRDGKTHHFLYVCEGDGSNLLNEDIVEGYVDYAYITTYTFDGWEFEEDDGGTMMLKEMYQDVYPKGEELKLAKDALDFIYGNIGRFYILDNLPMDIGCINFKEELWTSNT